MKTYSRKKLGGNEQEIIIDLNDVCRLCMNKEDELVAIYSNDDAIPLTLRIMACVALEVFEGDGLPDKICRGCKLQLEKSYNFRKKCENSDMKLRQHLREIRQFEEHSETLIEVEEVHSDGDTSQAGPSTEEDLVGVTKVTYIEQDHEVDDDPENITLPQSSDDSVREACTMRTVDEDQMVKTKTENEALLIMPDAAIDNELESHNMDAIADVVKATLANQTGLNISGQLQMKISQSNDSSTQVEVTTEDGAVIVMELMAEEEAEEVTEALKDTTKMTESGELKIFQCPVCPKSFSRRIQLKRHASVHMEQRGFSCGICEKWFPTRSALIRHERIHTGERPFQCEVCQKSFAQKEILFRHLMTHSGQKPYNCPQCDKGFSQKESLRIHIRTHATTAAASDIQLHYCSLCPKVFCHASGLSRHLITHTGKTFKCEYCDKAFTDKSSLRRHHLQTNHSI